MNNIKYFKIADGSPKPALWPRYYAAYSLEQVKSECSMPFYPNPSFVEISKDLVGRHGFYLASDILTQLQQGTKIEFKDWGHGDMLFVGRIELDRNGRKYFVNEHAYENICLLESMRFYNELGDQFTHFKVLD